MNYKKLIPIFIIFSLTLLFSQVYAEECNIDTGPAGATWIREDGSSCICQETISTDANGTEVINYLSICSIKASSSPGGKVPMEYEQRAKQEIQNSGISQNRDTAVATNNVDSACREDIDRLNLNIKELNLENNGYIKDRLNNIRQARQKIDSLLNEYKDCRLIRIKNQSRPNSVITGNLTLADSTVMSDVSSTDSLTSITMPSSDSTMTTADDSEILSLDKIEEENTEYIDSIQEKVNTELNSDFNLTENCKEKLNLVKEQINIIKDNKDLLKTYKEENKKKLERLKELIKQRNEKLKDCFGFKEENFDCKVPEELIKRLKELDELRNRLKEDLASDSETSSLDSTKDEYTRVKEEYLALSEKIKTIKSDCITRQNTTRIENICTEKTDILKKMDELKSAIELTTSDKGAYELKTKLEYLNKKYNNVVCLETVSSSSVAPSTSQDTLTIPVIDQKDNANIDVCVNNFVNKAGIEEDVARFACQKKYSLENKGYTDRVSELESKIRAQQQVIDNLKSKIKDIQERINNATPEERAKFIQDNSADIKEDTLAKIDKRIESLKKLIENIENSEMIETNKTDRIDSINTRIANLEMLKTNITNAETTDELKTYIQEARVAEVLANREFIISSLKNQIVQLDKIITTYLASNSDYQAIKAEVDSLNTKLSEVSEDSSNQDLENIKDEYFTLKEKVKSLAKGVENK